MSLAGLLGEFAVDFLPALITAPRHFFSSCGLGGYATMGFAENVRTARVMLVEIAENHCGLCRFGEVRAKL
jgi:hypothetical protein